MIDPLQNRLKEFKAMCSSYKYRISDSALLQSLNSKYLSQNSAVLSDDKIENLKSYMRAREQPRFLFEFDGKMDILSVIEQNFERSILETIKRADEICEHKFSFLGSEVVQFGNKIDWHSALCSGKSWPKLYSTDIDCRGEKRIGDVKLTWELNRHQYFIELGKAYWYTDDEKYAKEFSNQIVSWIKQSPVGIGVNWDNALEVALRSISWIWAYHYFQQSNYFSEHALIPFLKAILQNGRFIKEHLSIGGLNHLIGEAAGLAFIGILFPEFKEAAAWKELGLKILAKEIDRQVHDDGVNKEQSVAYHRFVTDFYLLILRLAELNGIKLTNQVGEKTEKMLEYLMYLTKPDKTQPMIGDSDDGKVVAIDTCNPNQVQTTLAIGAVLFERQDFKFTAGENPEVVLWFFGSEGFSKYQRMSSLKPDKDSIAFDNAGYYVMRTGWGKNDKYLIFDCGEQGMGNAPHGHADALSFELYALEKTLITDSGTYTYNGPIEWRNYFKGTSAHNTIVVDRSDQADVNGTFRWENKVEANLRQWKSTDEYDFVDALHNGYTRLEEPVIHRRRILFVKPDYWIIEDLLTGKGKHFYECFFHLTHDDIEIEGDTKIANIKIDEDKFLFIIPLETSDLEVEVQRGWISYAYGEKVERPVLRYSKFDKVPIRFVTILYPYNPKKDSQITVGKIKQKAELDWDRYVEVKDN